MNTKAYLIYIDHTYVTHNALQVAFMKFLNGMNRKVVPGIQLEVFKKYFILIAADISREFPRCKPIDIYFEEDVDYISGRTNIVLRWNSHTLCSFKLLETELTEVSI